MTYSTMAWLRCPLRDADREPESSIMTDAANLSLHGLRPNEILSAGKAPDPPAKKRRHTPMRWPIQISREQAAPQRQQLRDLPLRDEWPATSQRASLPVPHPQRRNAHDWRRHSTASDSARYRRGDPLPTAPGCSPIDAHAAARTFERSAGRPPRTAPNRAVPGRPCHHCGYRSSFTNQSYPSGGVNTVPPAPSSITTARVAGSQ